MHTASNVASNSLSYLLSAPPNMAAIHLRAWQGCRNNMLAFYQYTENVFHRTTLTYWVSSTGHIKMRADIFPAVVQLVIDNIKSQ